MPLHRFSSRARAVSALVALVALTAVTPSIAEPARTTLTWGHTHAPYVEWASADDEDDERRSPRLSVDIGTSQLDPAHTHLWMRRGTIEEKTGTRAVSRFRLTEANHALFPFLGEAGSTWFYTGENQNPDLSSPYVGLNDDGSAPHDELDGRTYSVDLVETRGPGRMEAFARAGASVQRRFSSTDLDHRSFYAPRHSHYVTVFSKPGAYEVEFAATGRWKSDKAFFSSEHRAMLWQVGGTDPSERRYPDIPAAWNAHLTGALPSSPVFSIAPAPHDAELSTFTFSTGDQTAGTLILLIDGFFLAEVPLVEGRASFTEMLGAGASSYQAVIIPDDAAAGVWASEPIDYTTGQEGVHTSVRSPDLAERINRSGNTRLDYTPRALASPIIEFDMVKDESGDHRVSLKSADPALSAYVKVELGNRYDEYTKSIRDALTFGKSIETTLSGGRHITMNESFEFAKNSKILAVSVLPHSRFTASAQSFVIKDFALADEHHFLLDLATGSITSRPNGSADETPAPPSPGGDAPGNTPTPPVPAPPTPAPPPMRPIDPPNPKPTPDGPSTPDTPPAPNAPQTPNDSPTPDGNKRDDSHTASENAPASPMRPIPSPSPSAPSTISAPRAVASPSAPPASAAPAVSASGSASTPAAPAVPAVASGAHSDDQPQSSGASAASAEAALEDDAQAVESSAAGATAQAAVSSPAKYALAALALVGAIGAAGGTAVIVTRRRRILGA